MRYVYIFLRVLVAAAVATDVYRLFDPKYLIGQISTAIFGLIWPSLFCWPEGKTYVELCEVL